MTNISRITPLAPLILALAILAGGCSPDSEIIEQQGHRYYRHNGLHFQLLVPAQWTANSMASDLAVQLSAPRQPGSPAAAVHVFSRRHGVSGSAEEIAATVLEQMQQQMAVLPGEEVENIALSQVTIAGREAKLMTRHIRQGPTRIQQQIYLLQEGSQLWSLIISVPAEQTDRYAEDIAAIRESFEVW